VVILLIGLGWYIWLPDKGQEIAAWMPVKVKNFVWTIGLSTPLPDILESTRATKQIRNSILFMTLATVLALGLLIAWVQRTGQQGHVEQALRPSEQRRRQVIDLAPHFIFAKDVEGRFVIANCTKKLSNGNVSSRHCGKVRPGYAFGRSGQTATDFDQPGQQCYQIYPTGCCSAPPFPVRPRALGHSSF
jgi:hypothetical protein